MFPFHYNSSKNFENEATKILYHIPGPFLTVNLKAAPYYHIRSKSTEFLKPNFLYT